MDSKMHVAIRSYKRAGTVTSLNILPFAKIWIPESQYGEYLKHYDKDTLRTIPDECDGNPSKKSNAILDRCFPSWVIMTDDDLGGIGYWENNNHYWMSPNEILEMITKKFILAEELGVKLWGLNQNKDPLVHYTYRPLSLLCPILSPFGGHLDNKLRYDEDMDGKEDYDFFLQHIHKYRKTLRFNKYHYIHKHGISEGGLAGIRTMQWEKGGVQKMRKKWGDKVFRSGGSTGGKPGKRNNILNCFVRVPLKGC